IHPASHDGLPSLAAVYGDSWDAVAAGGSVSPAGRDDHDRAVGMLSHLAAHRAHHQLGEATYAAGSDDQHVGATRGVDELPGGEAHDGPDGDGRWLGPVAEAGQHLVNALLGGLPQL